MADVVLENISKKYADNVDAVRDVSLSLPDEKFVVLVGPSGCGKTTLLRMIAGLEEITAGTIRIGNREVNGVPAKDRDVAMVFQNYALYPHMSVRQNLAFGLKLKKIPKSEIAKRIADTTNLLGISELLERKPAALSGGQRQRVAMGRAMIRNPAVFLFDEPLSNLDARLRVEMRRELSALHRRLKTTMIYVTHDQVEVMTLGEKIVVMDRGEIQQVGTPMEVYDHPTNRFVGGFLGTPPMNFFEGRWQHENTDSFWEMQGEKMIIPEGLDPLKKSRSIGIRPEHFVIENKIEHREDHAHQFHLSAVVEDFQTLGSESLIFLRGGNCQIVARQEGRPHWNRNDKVRVVCDHAYLHFFDEHENRIEP